MVSHFPTPNPTIWGVLRLCYLFYWCNFWKKQHLKNKQSKKKNCYLWFFTNFHDFSHDGVGASKSWFLIFQHQIQLYGWYFAFAICFIDVIFGKNNIWRTNNKKTIFVTYDFLRIFMIFHTMASELANHDFSFSNIKSNYMGDTSPLLSILLM